jgi:hypothetical protein
VFKKKDGTEVDEAAEAPKQEIDDAAYEDSWYRSLKAMAAKTHGAKGVDGAEGAEEEDDDEAGSEA